jgi:macrolide transport system ATP-binding/permease protein
MGHEPLLRLREVTKVYEKGAAAVRALDGIDLDIDAGDYVALTGSSGSGKSTLLHVLGCLDRPTSGSYRIDGEEVARLEPDELAERRRAIGFVFQAFRLLARQTAVDNVAMPLRYAGVAPRSRRARAVELLERVGLGDRLDHRPGELSGGQQQRVAVARALVASPRVLLCDEPTGLDSQAGAEVVDLLEELWREGRTLVVVTHDAALAARAQRRVHLCDGRIGGA